MSGLASAIEELASEDLHRASASTLADDLIELRRRIDQLEAQWCRRVVAFDRVQGWRPDGALSAAAWLRWRCGLAPGAARERVTVARRLDDELPETSTAFEAGEVSYAHVRLIADATGGVHRHGVREAEPILVRAARKLDPSGLRRAVAHWRHAVDAEAAIDAANAAHSRRRLHASKTFEGMVALDGELDPEGGATLMTALDAMAQPDAAGLAPRTPAQRRADALVELARRALDAGGLPRTGGERPHLTMTVDLSTLERGAGAKAAELEWAGPICGETARRLACDAGVTRVITDGASQPLDVGRRTQSIPSPLRRAVIVRDRRCAFPGCDRPPPWADVHHVVHYVDGGRTALENLALLCRAHHRLVHEGGWRIVRHDGLVFHRADGSFVEAPRPPP